MKYIKLLKELVWMWIKHLTVNLESVSQSRFHFVYKAGVMC